MRVGLRGRRGGGPLLGRREGALVVDGHGGDLAQVKVAVAGPAVGGAGLVDRLGGRGERVATGVCFCQSQFLPLSGHKYTTYDAQQAMYPLDQLSSLCVAQPDGHTRGLATGTTELEAPDAEL